MVRADRGERAGRGGRAGHQEHGEHGGRGWAGWARTWRFSWPGLVGLAIGALVLGPALAPGFVLTYDMVFVPDPPANAQALGLTGGFPRPVPSDAVIAALATLLPAQLVQKLVLLSVFVLAAWGAARLVPVRHPVPRLAAALCYTWNPFVAERLLLGHWALLLGYAGLPWVAGALVAADRPRHAVARLVRALVPAAIGGFAAVTISLVTVAGLLIGRLMGRRHRPPREARGPGGRAPGRRGVPGPLALAVLVAMSLPWLVPALLRRGTPYGSPDPAADPAGIALFAARADTPFGSVGSLLSLGGIWNGDVVPPGYANPIGAAGRLALALVAIGAYGWLLARRGSGAGAGPARQLPLYRGLAVAAGAGLAVACLGLTEPGRALAQWLVGVWPGFGALRDAQVYIAPLALLEAVGVGALAGALLRPVARAGDAAAAGAAKGAGTNGAPLGDAAAAGAARSVPAGDPVRPRAERADPGGLALAVLLLIAPIALLPALGWGVAGRLAAVSYPADWVRARATIERDPVPGAVLSLPWAAHRRLPWNGGRTLLDPAPRMFPRRVVWNDALRVGGRDTVAEDPSARAADAALRSPEPLVPALAAAGYRYVVLERSVERAGEDSGTGTDALRERLVGAERVVDGSDLTVYRITRPAPFREPRPPLLAPVMGGLITLLLTVWSFGVPGSSLIPLRHTRR